MLEWVVHGWEVGCEVTQKGTVLLNALQPGHLPVLGMSVVFGPGLCESAETPDPSSTGKIYLSSPSVIIPHWTIRKYTI